MQSSIVSFGPRFRFPYATLHHLDCTSKANKIKALVRSQDKKKIAKKKQTELKQTQQRKIKKEIEHSTPKKKEIRRRENDMLWNTQHERNRGNHIISSGLLHSFLHVFVLLALKPPANGCNIVGYCMLRPFAHPAAYCCAFLGVVEQSLKTAKLLTQRLPTFLLFRDRRSVAQQCWICLHSSFQHCWGHVAKHANHTWSPIYPPHDALQVPKFGSCSICTPLHIRKEASNNSLLPPFAHNVSRLQKFFR